MVKPYLFSIKNNVSEESMFFIARKNATYNRSNNIKIAKWLNGYTVAMPDKSYIISHGLKV